jgi:hypothetical protein
MPEDEPVTSATRVVMAEERTGSAGWRPRTERRRVSQVRPRPLVLAIAALQVVLPLSMLGARWEAEGSRPVTERPASWQMYSSVRPARYSGIDGQGRRRPLDVRRLPPVVRAVDLGRVVPARLCTLHPDLVAVRREGGVEPGDFRC